MVKFSQKDIYLKDNDMIVFGTDHDSSILWDGTTDELCLSTTISGVYPTQGYHLTTKNYVDTSIASISGADTVYFDAYDSSGGTAITTTWTDVPFDVVRYMSSGKFSHSSGSAEVTINEDGIYVIIARVTTTITTGTSRTDSSMRLMVDKGSGFTVVSGTTAVMYNRTANLGENTGTVAVILALSNGDKLKIQAKRDNGSSTLALLAEGSSLTIFTTKGAKGEKGERGEPGSGSTIVVEHDDTTVSGSPFSILNFTGDTIKDVYDDGGGQATIYIENDFGSWYAWNSSEGTSSTTSTSWQDKVSLSTDSDLPAGYYRIGYQFEWRRNSTTNDFRARLMLDGSTTIMQMNAEAKDANSWYLVGGFDIVQLTAGAHTFTLQYCGETTGATSRIRRARLEFWMMSSS